MLNLARYIFVLSSSLGLGACICGPKPLGELPAPMPVAALPPHLPTSATQVLHVQTPDRVLSLQCAFSGSASGWRSACVNASGMRMLSLQVTQDGAIELVRGIGLPDSFDPRFMVADMQLALWPLRLLQDASTGTPWSVHTDREKKNRRLHYRDQLFAEVAYADDNPWNGAYTITHHQLGYRLRVDSRTHTQTPSSP